MPGGEPVPGGEPPSSPRFLFIRNHTHICSKLVSYL